MNNVADNAQRFRKGLSVETTLNNKLAFAITVTRIIVFSNGAVNQCRSILHMALVDLQQKILNWSIRTLAGTFEKFFSVVSFLCQTVKMLLLLMFYIKLPKKTSRSLMETWKNQASKQFSLVSRNILELGIWVNKKTTTPSKFMLPA